MNVIAIAILAQLAVPLHATRAVLTFPEHGMDDSAAYAGYTTRLYRDAAGNTVQLYLDQRTGRIVTLLADAEDESVGVSARDGSGTAVPITWGAAGASTGRRGQARVFEQQLLADGARVHVTDILLGSMRVERDFQYWRAHHDSLATSPFVVPEYRRLVAAMAQLPADERARELALLNARDLEQLRARLRPSMTVRRTASSWSAVVVQPALDARDTLVLELRVDPRLVDARVSGDSVLFVARSGARVPFTVRITTTGGALTPLGARDIFTSRFLHLVDSARTAANTPAAALRARWLDRQVRETELLSSHQKVMAGLPNYATYFGRDMLVTALMMRPIWRPEMSEFVLAAALRKLRADGWVSHEEAIGWQSTREAAGEYATLAGEWRRASDAHRTAGADSLLARARTVLRDARRVRENYHMIDANFQLPVLAARWLTDPSIPAARKRAFLADVASGESNLRLLLRELALVARLSAPYVQDPVARNLISFPLRDSTRCQSASWRDSDAGYAGGCFAMDVNALWAPHALVALQRILGTLHTLGVPLDSVARTMPELGGDSPLGTYVRSPGALGHAIDVWRGATHQFLVTLSAADVRARVAARVAALPAAERNYWEDAPSTAAVGPDSLAFLALALDARGRAIDIANSDPATGLFLSGTDSAAARAVGTSPGDVLRDVRTFALAYPVGLLVPRVGPVVANDTYASPSVWSTFEKDQYHGPRVVWGREVNLFLLGTAGLIESARGDSASQHAYVSAVRAALDHVHTAVDSAGFRSELWTYEIVDGRPKAVRYGTGSDVQLWSTSDLAVQFALEQLRRSTITAPARRVAGAHPAR